MVCLTNVKGKITRRETVDAIARRKGAIAAINCSFFEIGNSEDGRPSGTLIIDGHIFGLTKGIQSYLAIKNENIEIDQGDIELRIIIDKTPLIPDQVNQFVKNNEIAFYTQEWGKSSLTPNNRKEILFSPELKILEVINHGDNPIPLQGFILSFPENHPLPLNQLSTLQLLYNGKESNLMKNIVRGIPLLVHRGKIMPNLDQSNSHSFSARPQARTAIGIHADGRIVIVVIEHIYTKPLKEITLGEVQSILQKEYDSPAKYAGLTFAEVRAIIEKNFSSKEGSIGLTLTELATLMLDLGCSNAINLDGGGSSTLFLNGQIINQTVGDEDESLGKQMVRPVSDAIVIKKKDSENISSSQK